MATKYTIEMATPDDLDPSALLERMQEVAVELGGELSEREAEAIRDTVSVQPTETVTETVNDFPYAVALLDGQIWVPVVARINLERVVAGKRVQVVLVDRGEGERERWVTGVHVVGAEGWDHGHYFDDLIEARADLAERARGR